MGWLEEACLSHDLVAIGGDLDDPYLGIPRFKLSYLLHRLRPNSVRDRLIGLAAGRLRGRVVVVLGNHDNPDPRALHGSTVQIGGLTVGGVGGSLPSGRFPFQLGEGEYESILRRMGRVDVLVVHQPPFGTRCDVAYGGRHVGSRAVRDYVLRERPRLVLTGHIHESPAVDRLGDSTLLNPGPFFEGRYGEADLDPPAEGGVRARILALGAAAPGGGPGRTP